MERLWSRLWILRGIEKDAGPKTPPKETSVTLEIVKIHGAGLEYHR
jgi:hypothetical protein